MGLLSAAVRSPFLLRRLLVELRGLRRATERLADCAELQAQQAPRSGQSFRSFSHEKSPSDGQGSQVDYADAQQIATMLGLEADLTAVLGRAPSEVELERAYRGEVE